MLENKHTTLILILLMILIIGAIIGVLIFLGTKSNNGGNGFILTAIEYKAPGDSIVSSTAELRVESNPTKIVTLTATLEYSDEKYAIITENGFKKDNPTLKFSRQGNKIIMVDSVERELSKSIKQAKKDLKKEYESKGFTVKIEPLK